MPDVITVVKDSNTRRALLALNSRIDDLVSLLPAAAVDVPEGFVTVQVRNVSGSATWLTTDYRLVFIDTGTILGTANLPIGPNKREVEIEKQDAAGRVLVVPSSGQTVMGDTQGILLNKGESWKLTLNDGDWQL